MTCVTENRLRAALRLAITSFEQLVDPDPKRGILTYVKLEGERQGVPLDGTHSAIVDLIAVLREDLGEPVEDPEHVAVRLAANSVANRVVSLTDRVNELTDRVNELVAAIRGHRAAIQAAGEVLVHDGFEQVAEQKHGADQRLWSVLRDRAD